MNVRRHPPGGREPASHDRRQTDPERRAGLHQRAIVPTPLRRKRLADDRLPRRPLSADADGGDDASEQQRPEADRQARQKRARRVHDDRPLQNRLAPIAIRQAAEGNAAESSAAERHTEHQGGLVAAEAEVVRDRDEQERVENQIVEVEQPPASSGREWHSACAPGAGLD
jgi:hypothetical protein